MKVGDYVRTRWGCIAKFEGIHEGFYEFDNIIMDESSAVREELFVDIAEKSSPNIIDLIEVGDYVNGYRVESVDTEYAPYGVYIEIPFVDSESIGCNMDLIRTEEIESIVTKEQFESMEYEIGE